MRSCESYEALCERRMSPQPQAASPHEPAAPSRGLLQHVPLAVAVGVVAIVYAPVLRFGFVSDDFQWWQHAAAALRQPALLIAPFGGFRPAFTWVLVLENLAFGASPLGYHAVELALFLLCGVLLAALLQRLGFGPLVRACVAALWSCSPFCTEPVFSVVSSIYLLMLACWLGLALLWPGPGESWRRGRAVGAIALAAFTVGLLESWVMLPGLALVFEVGLRGASLRTAVRRVAWTLIPVFAYVAAYFSHPPFKVASYYSVGIAGAAKIPHIWASFLDLTTLRPLQIGFGAPELLGLTTLVAFAWIGFRRRSRVVLLGFGFFLLPLLPLVPVPFVPTRYTTAPFAGFLMVVVGVATGLARDLGGRGATLARLATGALAAVYLVAGVFWVQSEIADWRRLDGLHRGLLAEAARFAPFMPSAGVVVCANCEHDNPLRRLSQTPLGLPKAYFVRHGDPYGLIDTAALWSWLLYPRGGPMYRYASLDSLPPGPFTVVVHEEGRFGEVPATGSVREVISTWQRRGCYVRLLTPW